MEIFHGATNFTKSTGFFFEITDDGRARLAEADRLTDQMTVAAYGVLSESQKEQFRRVLADMVAAVEAYDKALASAGIPMLLLTFTPGAIVTAPEIVWCKANWPTLTVKDMGAGIHFVQEDQPEAIGKAIATWLGKLK